MLCGACAAVILFTAFSLAPAATRAAEVPSTYTSNWMSWSQGDSGYGAVRWAGCRIIAHAKLLAEARILEPGSTPDDYYEWMRANGWILGSIDERFGNGGPFHSGPGSAILDYAANHGYTLERVGTFDLPDDPEERVKEVWSYLEAGFYVILDCSVGGMHQTYVARDLSLQKGEPWITDSFSAGYTVSFANGIFPYTGTVQGVEKNYTKAYVYSFPFIEPDIESLDENAYLSVDGMDIGSTDVTLRCSLDYLEASRAVMEVGVKIGRTASSASFCDHELSTIGFIKGSCFEFHITDLAPLTKYYFLFYAKSEEGSTDETRIVYSEFVSFATDPLYTVSYNANGGTGAPEDQYKPQKEDLILSDVIPRRKGFRFLGWSWDDLAIFPDYQPGESLCENLDLVLYAVWEVGGESYHDEAFLRLYDDLFPEEMNF